MKRMDARVKEIVYYVDIRIGDRMRIRNMEAEIERLENMMTYERSLYQVGKVHICGIDEAGRGPLMGPVVAAAVILPKDLLIPGVNDSKKVSEKNREFLFHEITEKALAYGIGIVDAERIDEVNILNATKEAMRMAIEQLSIQPDHLLIDAVKLEGVDISLTPIVKGDAVSQSIAAASILAKVTRDRLVVEIDEKYPEFGFRKNKGYGTAEHIAALKKNGPLPVHRRSFIKNFFK